MVKTRFSSKAILAGLLSLGLLFFASVGTASAHAKVIDSDPKPGKTIASVPSKVTVTTAENMKPGAQFSNLFVYGPNGDLVSQGDASIALNDPTHMSVNIKDAGKGIYIVRWITVSADDGDPDQGAFVFTVGAAAASTPAVTPVPTQQTTATTSTSSTGGTPIWVAVVVGIVALLVGLGAGMGLGRARAASAEATATGTTASVPEEEPTRRP